MSHYPDDSVPYPDWLCPPNAIASHPVDIHVRVYVPDGGYPFRTPHGVLIEDVLHAVVWRLGNGNIPADGVTAQPMAVYLELREQGIE